MISEVASQPTETTSLISRGSSDAVSSNGRRYTVLCPHRPWYSFFLCPDCSHSFVARYILPSSNRMPHNLDSLRLHLPGGSYRLKIPTTDGVTLDGVYITPLHLSSMRKIKTIIYFNGNNTFYEFHAGVKTINFPSAKLRFINSNIPEFLEKGFAVFLFNYRGVGSSGGYPTRKGLRIDGETIYQFVHTGLHVKSENIILYGHSLGGAIATQVASRHKKVSIISDRSFSSLSQFLTTHFGVFGYFTSDLLWQVDWEMDNLKLWERIKGKKCVIYHPNDRMIPLKTSLKTALYQYDPHTKFVRLDVANLKKYYHKLYADQISKEMTDADREIIEKELQKEDTHCRNLTPSELDEVLSYFE